MSVCVDYYYFVLVLFSHYSVSLCGLLLFYFGTVPSNYIMYLICQSVCGLLLFCFGTVPSNWYVICQSVLIIIILFWYCSL